jgi:membrane associated rhomboid family serine protease
MDKKIILLMASLTAIYVAVFLIPNHADKLALIPEKVQVGQYWRFITYPFAHLSIRHLVENIIGAALVGIIAMELKTEFIWFALIYLLAGFLAVLPIWFAMQFIALGASTAIFGGFGMVSQETKKYDIKGFVIIALFMPFIFVHTIMGSISGSDFSLAFKQDLSHLSGFIFGIGMFFLVSWISHIVTKPKRQLLRRMSQ